MNLSNLWHLQHTMSINDMYDALEAIDVAQSWAEAFRRNQAEQQRRR